ncbi:MAG: thymidylate synthase [Sulfitobacter litoralis]|uniref:Thymidylate synthase n=1 Tax=Sulfitobacter litoralis TaxID=335975 RepID=A0ABY0SGH1_9RHOB|nr:thymidylate synthase [Sulfitobacter litoralis]MBQ0717586.1 thymidylate synthase [Sulfitobacter litoralis]MBQ0800869.1 thymidylate synthase [Sulfitobacter litoralis]SDP21838.1 hypothetical protein SAMN04488512_11173 [Sulfitobacter litoralis]
MKFGTSALALCAFLAACGSGTPFNGKVDVDTGTDGSTGASAIPEALTNDLKSFSYDPASETLSITGITADDSAFTAAYRRRPGLDRNGYEAYTAQDGSLDRHVTAYVKDIDGTRAAVVMTGGQFEQVFSGAAYSSTSYSAPVAAGAQSEGGLVTYAGNYVGLLNGSGSGEDLEEVTPGTDTAPLSRQAAEVTGKVVLTGDFTDAAVAGIIYDRKVTDYNAAGGLDPNSADPFKAANIALDNTGIADDGSFFGVASQSDTPVGEYGGIFGGLGATEVAGVIHAENHIGIGGSGTPIEYGAFVLTQCGQPGEDPICDQPVR